jgi:hypothetical protein
LRRAEIVARLAVPIARLAAATAPSAEALAERPGALPPPE